MDRDQLAMLQEVMALSFTAFELSLYLNTHPRDQRALADFNTFYRQTEELTRHYEELYVPLTHKPTSPYWKWIDEPWPWDINYR